MQFSFKFWTNYSRIRILFCGPSTVIIFNDIWREFRFSFYKMDEWMGVASLILLGKMIFYIFLLIYVYVTLKESMTEERRDASMEEGKERK